MATTLEAAPPAAPSVTEPPRRHRGRVRPPEHRPMPADRALSWVITAAITVLAATVRLWGIGFPSGKQFDEVYYATEGGELLHNGGYENNPGYMFIVHPPFGKWLVAAGIAVFGDGPVGWRVPSAIAGTLCVLILIRVVRRMTRSTLLGAVAGILLGADGLSIVQSRFALLDIFLALFVLAGFACLVVDRDVVRDRIAAGGPYGSRIGFRGWRLAGGVLLGLSCGVKWSGVYFLAGFAVLSVLWDVGARRAAGVPRPWTGTALRDLPGAVGSYTLAPVAAYLVTWSGWFLSENSYDRHWADTNPGYGSFLPGPLRSLLRYHSEMWQFHSGLSTPHTYQSSPWGWLVTGRPVLFYYPSNPSPTGCGASSCVRTVLDVGTPALWWAFAPAVLWAAWIALVRRDWRGWTVLVAFLAGWVTWFSVPGRTMFLFYMTPLVPFLVIGVTLILGAVLGSARAGDQRRLLGLVGVCGYVALVVINSAWLWPILSGQLITYQEWRQRIWFPSWI
ncbi:MAG TPA: phospholipid carrier-dependent glycosyltransferase [Mycobacteriales bacterium]